MLASIELRDLFGFDLDLAAGLRVHAGPSLAGTYFPGAKAGNANLLALLQSCSNGVDEGIEHSGTLFLGKIGLLGDLIDQFALVHSNSPPIPHE